MTKPAYFVVAAVLAAFGASPAHAASDPNGIWLDDSGRGAVEIKPCGGALCGYVVAVKNANDQKGCGKQIIGDARAASGGVWDSGWIYSPERRKNYDVELKPLKDGTLRVVGYAGTKLFSRTMIWRPAPGDLQRCDVQAAPKPAPAPAAQPAVIQATPAPASSIDPKVGAADKSAAEQVKAAPQAATPTPAPAAPQKTAAAPVAPSAPAIAPPADAPPAASAPPAPETAQGDDDDAEGGEKPGQRKARGGLQLGDLDLDKVIKRTRNGNCKIDLPFVKVSFKCED